MAHFEKITFLLCLAAAAYGASIRPVDFRDESSNSTFLSQIDKENMVEDTPLSPTNISLADSQNGFEISKLIADLLTTMIAIFQRTKISEQSMKSLIQMIAGLAASYFGRQSQLILPVLTGIATTLMRSLAAA